MHSRSPPAWLMISTFVIRLCSASALAQERANRLIAILASGGPAIGVWTGATAAPRITKILATSDA